MNYLTRLEEELTVKEYDDDYKALCIDYAKKLLKNKVPVIFDKHHLSKLMGIDMRLLAYYIHQTDFFYREFSIAKKSGGNRIINTPSYNLKKIQKWIAENILCSFLVHPSATGFCKGKSILDNASPHINKNVVYNIDIKDFFPSIEWKDVYFIFYNKGYTKELSYYFAKLLTYQGYLPQGSPASPILANIKCYNLDVSLNRITEKFMGNYTRYADDITFSTNNIDGIFYYQQTIREIVGNHNFKLNGQKERIQFSNNMQEVTGLIVNNGVKVRRAYKKEIEKHIYFCQKYGVDEHLKKNGMESKSFFKEYLYGKVFFVKMVEPEIGIGYIKQLDEIVWAY